MQVSHRTLQVNSTRKGPELGDAQHVWKVAKKPSYWDQTEGDREEVESSVQEQEFRAERNGDQAGEGSHVEQCSDAGGLLKEMLMEQSH